MGWKRFKEHYRIGHAAHRVEGEGFCIASAYCYNLIVVDADGRISKRYGTDGWGSNEDLLRYQKEIDADPGLCRRLLAEPDVFSQSLPVWTFSGGDIIEKQCEEYGWPNCTHDGEMMYDNRHFKTREEAVEKAIEDAEAGVRISMRRSDGLGFPETPEDREPCYAKRATVSSWLYRRCDLRDFTPPCDGTPNRALDWILEAQTGIAPQRVETPSGQSPL